MTKKLEFICDFRVPPRDKECLEMIWSSGKTCRKCPVTCYRQGMTKTQVRVDNAKLVHRETGTNTKE
jgi:hypothetical protein